MIVYFFYINKQNGIGPPHARSRNTLFFGLVNVQYQGKLDGIGGNQKCHILKMEFKKNYLMSVMICLGKNNIIKKNHRKRCIDKLNILLRYFNFYV